jgi:DNA protecting protein DprA
MGYGYTRHDAEQQGYTTGVIASLGVADLPGIGWLTLRQFGSPEAVLELFSCESLPEFTHAVNAAGGKFVPAAAGIDSWQALRETVWKRGLEFVVELVARQVQCITAASPDFPARFEQLGIRRPFWLFLRGRRELLDVPSIAVVGTRSPSWAGEFLTEYAVSAVAEFRAPVVSGLARGIDSVAHEWALRLNLPTISVLGSGLLSPYPARNAGLADRIVAAGGLLVSEYLPRQQPTAEMFVWRNRLQACISACVIATEWQRASGTAHTVKFAADLHRPSISTHLITLPCAAEAGNGKHHFELPREHANFCETISAALQAVNVAKSSVRNPTAADQIKEPDLPPSINRERQAEREQKLLF